MPVPEEPTPTSASSPRPEPGGLFTEPAPTGRSFPTAAVVIAVIAVLVVVIVLGILGRRHAAGSNATNTLQPLAAYAPQLKLSGIQLSESTSFSGGKETFVDGHVANTGAATVTGVGVQVLFAPEGGGAPQMETVPLTLIRSRQPYVDTEPVSAAPLAPGASADFRLTFDDVRPEWNQQPPEIRITTVKTR